MRSSTAYPSPVPSSSYFCSLDRIELYPQGPRKANPCGTYQGIDLLISSILGSILKMPSSKKIYSSFLLYYLSITLLYNLLYPTHPPTNLMEIILGILTYFSECDVLKEKTHPLPYSTYYCGLILALA